MATINRLLSSKGYRTEASAVTSIIALLASWFGIEPEITEKIAAVAALLIPIFLGQRITATTTKRR